LAGQNIVELPQVELEVAAIGKGYLQPPVQMFNDVRGLFRVNWVHCHEIDWQHEA
jgi:hypothetical protein